MTISITDDLVTIDISESDVGKQTNSRIYLAQPPGQPADIVQHFGSLGLVLSINGTWVTAQGVNDGRSQLETWRKNNTLVRYTDGKLTGWFRIVKFDSKLVQGQPTSILVYYTLELAESIRLQRGETGLTQYDVDPLPVEGTFSTWTKQWDITSTNTRTVNSANIFIDEAGGFVIVQAASFIQVYRLADGSNVLDDTSDQESGTGSEPVQSPQSSIQHVYALAKNTSGPHTFSIVKSGAVLFTTGDNLATQMASISNTGKYVAVVYSSTHLALYVGS